MSAKNSGASRNTASSKTRSKNVTPISGGPASKSSPGALTQIDAALAEEIRVRAYALYEQRGRQDGFDQEDWIRAEEEILSRQPKEKALSA